MGMHKGEWRMEKGEGRGEVRSDKREWGGMVEKVDGRQES
jgi:hypothetical protein